VTKTSLFKANYGQDPRMGFKGRRKEKYEVAGKFIERIKKIQEEAKVALGKAQEEMKKFANRKCGEREEYRVVDLVLLCHDLPQWLSHYYFYFSFSFPLFLNIVFLFFFFYLNSSYQRMHERKLTHREVRDLVQG